MSDGTDLMNHDTINALAISYACAQGDTRDYLAREAYSYRLVAEAFAPLLQRWGAVQHVPHAESRLDFTLRRLRRQGKQPLHLSFLPLHLGYLTSEAPNVAFPFWEFPDIPDVDLEYNPRNNWRRIAERLTLLLTACSFTRDAFQRAGVQTPIHVVPVPIRDEYFRIPEWRPAQRVVLDCAAYVLPQAEPTPLTLGIAWEAYPGHSRSVKDWLRYWYGRHLRPRMPTGLARRLSWVLHPERRPASSSSSLPLATQPQLELEGIVYTAIFNPFDPRKNWADLLTAFVHALGDRPDATLVLKLVAAKALTERALLGVLTHYRSLGLRHRCKIAVVADYLTDEQMRELTRASTFHVNASRAEGANLPLQDFLAAARPAISPRHTAMSDYFHDEMGFVVASHPEPTRWPHAPDQHLRTMWHAPVWASLRDQLHASYTMATEQPRAYQVLAARSREQIEDFAGTERVWPQLAAALRAAMEVVPFAARGLAVPAGAKPRAAVGSP